MTKNTKAIIWATIAVMALIIGGVTYERQRPKRPIAYEKIPVVKTLIIAPDQIPIATSTEAGTSTPITVATSTPASKPILIRKPKPKPTTITTISYGDAVVKYGFNHIQFAPGCLQASPNQIATANPVTLMLDNRSDQAQTITIGSHSYMVAPYNYVIATINETTLPVTLFISCNQQKNVAEIILQR
jgi:hypothetical protein